VPLAEAAEGGEQQEGAAEAGPRDGADVEGQDKLWRDLHKLLLETQVVEGKMVCGNCGHEYKIKEGIANFLLPNHLV
jgi:multifunctional methyltransferase subunit TRM112